MRSPHVVPFSRLYWRSARLQRRCSAHCAWATGTRCGLAPLSGASVGETATVPHLREGSSLARGHVRPGLHPAPTVRDCREPRTGRRGAPTETFVAARSRRRVSRRRSHHRRAIGREVPHHADDVVWRYVDAPGQTTPVTSARATEVELVGGLLKPALTATSCRSCGGSPSGGIRGVPAGVSLRVSRRGATRS